MQCCGSRHPPDPSSPDSDELDDLVRDVKKPNSIDTPHEMVEWSVDPQTQMETFEDPYLWNKRLHSLNSPADSQETLTNDFDDDEYPGDYANMSESKKPRAPEKALPNVWDARSSQNKQRSYPPTNTDTIPRAALDNWPPIDALAAARNDNYPSSKKDAWRNQNAVSSELGHDLDSGLRNNDDYSTYVKSRPKHKRQGRESNRAARARRYEFHDSDEDVNTSRPARSMTSRSDESFANYPPEKDLLSYPKPAKIRKQQRPLHMPTEQDFDRYGRRKNLDERDEEDVSANLLYARQEEKHRVREKRLLGKPSKSASGFSKTHAASSSRGTDSSEHERQRERERSQQHRSRPDYDDRFAMSTSTLVPDPSDASPSLQSSREREWSRSKADYPHSKSSTATSQHHSKSRSKIRTSHHHVPSASKSLAKASDSASDMRRRASAPSEAQQQLKTIRAKFKTKIRPLVKEYIRNPPQDAKQRDYERKRLGEMMMREALLEYDAVAVKGDNLAGTLRQEGVRECNTWLDKLDKTASSDGQDTGAGAGPRPVVGREYGESEMSRGKKEKGSQRMGAGGSGMTSMAAMTAMANTAGMQRLKPSKSAPMREVEDRDWAAGYREEPLTSSLKAQGKNKKSEGRRY